jgi:hypothetical protein
MGIVSEILKLGLLTPVFKNKGSNKCAVNYRGITVTPVIQKIIETIYSILLHFGSPDVNHKLVSMYFLQYQLEIASFKMLL